MKVLIAALSGLVLSGSFVRCVSAETRPIVKIAPGSPLIQVGFQEANGDGMVGWTFAVTSPVTISQVGWYDEGQDGLIRSYQVGLWQDLTGYFALGSHPTQLLGTPNDGIRIPGQTGPPLNGVYRVVDLPSPLTLQPGNYELGGVDTFASSEPVQYILAQTHESDPAWVENGVNIKQFFYPDLPSPVSGLQVQFNTSFYLANGLELGPMVFVVPEPASLLLLGTGMLALLLRSPFCVRKDLDNQAISKDG